VVTFEFWKERWDTKQTGFHEGQPNDLLVAHADRLPPRSRILVPLAGKSNDLVWLAERGHAVVGVEFVKAAIDEFVEGFDVQRRSLGAHEAFEAHGVTMVLGDMFEIGSAALGTFDAIYDRAALIALEPRLRVRYVDTCRALLKETAVTLLIAMAYDQSKASGPPFSVDDREVRGLFAGRSIEALSAREADIPPRLREAGVDHAVETAYLIR
jgi:thiopurine S-methyltransferase